jgi:hypothetical protein
MSGIIADGQRRLRKTIEAEVRREFAAEVVKEQGFWKRQWIDQRIRREVNRRMKNLSSPGSLYFARRLGLAKRRY